MSKCPTGLHFSGMFHNLLEGFRSFRKVPNTQKSYALFLIVLECSGRFYTVLDRNVDGFEMFRAAGCELNVYGFEAVERSRSAR
jgi:hypothetical protein